MKKLLYAVLLIAFFSTSVFATTVNISNSVIELTSINADWNITNVFNATNHPNGVSLISIEFIGGAVNDKLVVKDGSDTAPAYFEKTIDDVKYSLTKSFNGKTMKFYIDYSACTLSTGHKVIIVIGDN